LVAATSFIARLIVLQGFPAPFPQQDAVSTPLTLSTAIVPGLAMAAQHPLGVVPVSQKFVPVPAQSVLTVHEARQPSLVALQLRLPGHG
jgi:hypothetical protein